MASPGGQNQKKIMFFFHFSPMAPGVTEKCKSWFSLDENDFLSNLIILPRVIKWPFCPFNHTLNLEKMVSIFWGDSGWAI